MLFLLAAAVTIPLGLDLYLPAPEDNPLTAEKIELGRRLFFDRRLSRDGSIALLQAQADLNLIASNLERLYPKDDTGRYCFGTRLPVRRHDLKGGDSLNWWARAH